MDNETQQSLQEELKKLGGISLTHDKFFSEMFEETQLACGFLRFVLPNPLVNKLDLDKLTVEDKEFLSSVFRKTTADVLYRIPIKNSEESLRVYIIVEHKSYNYFFTIYQAYGYAFQLNQREIQRAKDERRFDSNFRLSPVLIIIFYHGKEDFTAPTDVKYMFHNFDGVIDEKFLVRQEAITFNLRKLLKDEIPDDPNVPELFVVLWIMQNIFSCDVGTDICEVLERLKPYSDVPKYHDIIRKIWYYLICNVDELSNEMLEAVTETVKEIVGDPKMTTVLEKLLDRGRVEGEAKGRIEGRVEGRVEGEAIEEAKILLKILFRLGPVSDSLAEEINSMTDVDELDRLADIALTCCSLDEFTKYLQ